MATRPPRLKQPHTHFHVTTRGTNRWNIFLDDPDRQRFLVIVEAVCKRYGVEVIAYCLMGNHLHLLVYCPEPVLSAAMRDLKSRYAKYFNRRHRASGPVFEAPFVEVPILSDELLKREVRYISRNPLDLDPNICLATYPWSSHGIYCGLRPEPAFLNSQLVRALFGTTYRVEVERPRSSDKVQNRVRPTVHSPGEWTLSDSPDRSLASIQREVARAAGCDAAEVSPLHRNGLIGIAVIVAVDAGYAATEIAEPFGYNSEAAVYKAGRRARKRLTENERLRSIHQSVLHPRRSAA